MSASSDKDILEIPHTDVEGELWSSPLMHYTSPFDDYKELFDEIEQENEVFTFPDVPMERKLTARKFQHLLCFFNIFAMIVSSNLGLDTCILLS